MEVSASVITQLMILVTGVPAVWLSQSPSEKARRYACLFGMAGQPFWLYAALQADQWGILIVNVLYTVAWGRGLYTHWVRPLIARRGAEDFHVECKAPYCGWIGLRSECIPGRRLDHCPKCANALDHE